MVKASDHPDLDLTALSEYPEAQRATRHLVAMISRSLGPVVVGTYFDGSIALGDFDPTRSDVDIVVVTDGHLSDSAARNIAALHEAFARSSPGWGEEIEVIYASKSDLGQHAADGRTLSRYVERGTGGLLQTRPLGLGWLVHLRILSRNGFTISGPDIRQLVGAVSDEALRRGAALGATNRLRLYCDNPASLGRPGARAFAILTSCRMLHTFRTGAVVPKMEAARAALEVVDLPLANVIRAAMSWRKDDRDLSASPEDTVRLLQFVQDQCARES